MRVSFCKIHCPSSICFSKPSSQIYTPGQLNSENTSHVSRKPESDPQGEASIQLSVENTGTEQGGRNEEQKLGESYLKSSLRNPNLDPVASMEDRKKRVQWIDFLGKELAQIKEFESSESEENEDEGEGNRGCLCTIL